MSSVLVVVVYQFWPFLCLLCDVFATCCWFVVTCHSSLLLPPCSLDSQQTTISNKGLNYCTDDKITKFALLPWKKVINSTVLKSGDRLYHNKICDALDNLEHAQQKSFQRGYSHHVFTEKITSTALLEYNQTMLKLVFLHKHIIFQVCLLIAKTL